MVVINRKERKILISFDAKSISEKHASWLISIKERIGLGELNPQPYWGFDDLFHKAGTKLLNCFYVQAQVKHESGFEYFSYEKVLMLQKLSLEKFLKAIEQAAILVDFDARTSHNHGTKFRLRQDKLSSLYEIVTVIA
jgi:hypothetical protein